MQEMTYYRYSFLQFFCAVFFYYWFKKWFYLSTLEQWPDYSNPWVFVLFSAVLGLTFSYATYRDTSKSFSILYRGLIIIWLFYVITAYSQTPAELFPESKSDIEFLEFGRWLAIGCGILALFRPSWGLWLFLYPVYQRFILGKVTAETFQSITDYLTLIEFGIMIHFFFCLRKGLEKLNLIKQPSKPEECFLPFDILVFCVISLNFANYLAPAVYKIILDGGPLTWLLENDTYNILLTGLSLKTVPISHIGKEALDYSIGVLKFLVVPLNFIVLISQAFCMLALKNTRIITGILILLDIQHVAIFLISGIFFWKWVLLNLALIIAIQFFPSHKIPWRFYLFGIFLAVLGFLMTVKAHLHERLVFAPALAWYDTQALNQVYWEAELEDGKKVSVPSNYWLGLSMSFVGNRYLPSVERFPTIVYGVTGNWRTYIRAKNCNKDFLIKPGALDESEFSKLALFIPRHHKFILSKVNSQGHFNYDLFPHHVWSNPYEFEEFKKVDIRKIKKYRAKAASVCVFYQNKKAQKKTLETREWEFPLR